MSRRRLLTAGLTLWATAGCALDDAPSSGADDGRTSRLDADAFADELQEGSREVLNVHVPDEGSIAGTTLTIPFDRVDEQADRLPRERSTPLAVYCMTGRMSEVAVDTLRTMGYEDVVELKGGMQAWVDSGRPLAGATAHGLRTGSQ